MLGESGGSEGCVLDQSVVFNRTGYGVQAAKLSTGERVWEAPIEVVSGPFRYHMALYGGRIYVGGTGIYAINAATGIQVWNFKIPRKFGKRSNSLFPWWANTSVGNPAVADGLVFVAASDSTIYCLDSDSGRQMWKFHTEMQFQHRVWQEHLELIPYARWPVVSEGRVYFGGLDGCLYTLDTLTGRLIWKSRFDDAIYAPPAAWQGILFVCAASTPWHRFPNKLYAMDSRTGGALWDFELSGRVYASPVVWEGSVYVTARGLLYAFDATTGQEQWVASLDGVVFSSPAFWQQGEVEWPMSGGNPARTGTGTVIGNS